MNKRLGNRSALTFTLLTLVILPSPLAAVDDVEPVALEQMRQVAGEDLLGLETEHFQLYFSVHRLRQGKKHLRKEEAAQLYAERLEEVHDACSELLKPFAGRSRKHLVVITETEGAFQRVASKVTGYPGGDLGVYHYGDKSFFATYWDGNPAFKVEGDLHAKVTHHVAHLIIQDYGFCNLDFPAWVHVGFAHMIGKARHDSNQHHCHSELPREMPYRFRDWERLVRTEVSKRKSLSVTEVVGKPLDALDFRDMAYAMSFVTFLVETDPEKFKRFVLELKRNPETAPALKSVYGWRLGDLEDQWKKYVVGASN